MDRGYVDFERLARLDDAGAFFVTRAKSNLKARRRYSRPVDRSTGLICDQTIVLTGFYSRQGFQRPLRRIKFNDPQTGKRLVFLTNNFAQDALTIAKLYKCRWQVDIDQAWRLSRLCCGGWGDRRGTSRRQASPRHRRCAHGLQGHNGSLVRVDEFGVTGTGFYKAAA
jgi:hypothetical protein